MTTDAPVEYPPPAPSLNKADIARHVQKPFDNGHTPTSIEPSRDVQARLAARDEHLATLKLNEQGDLDRFAVRKETQD